MTYDLQSARYPAPSQWHDGVLARQRLQTQLCETAPEMICYCAQMSKQRGPFRPIHHFDNSVAPLPPQLVRSDSSRCRTAIPLADSERRYRSQRSAIDAERLPADGVVLE